MSGSNAAASLAQSFGDLQIEGSNNVVHQGISNNSKLKIQDCTHMLLWSSNKTAEIETGHFIVPRSVNGLFTGRENALERLSSQLGNSKQSAKGSEKQKRIVITGLGGVGKSELCLKLIDRVRKRFDNIFWVDVSSQQDAENGFMAISNAANLQAKTFQKVIQYLGGAQHTWLLVLDNADDLQLDFHPFFPAGSRGTVVMTSRNPECGEQYANTHWVKLNVLTVPHSVKLIMRAANIEDAPEHRTKAREVAKALGYHTLALVLAGSFIWRGHCTLDEYISTYGEHWQRTIEYVNPQERSRYGSVLATFEAAIAVLEKAQSDERRSNALDLLHILSMLAETDVPLSLFEEAWNGISQVHGDEYPTSLHWYMSKLPQFVQASLDRWDPYRLTEAYNTLKSLSLVTVSRTKQDIILSMHSLIHDYVRRRHNAQQTEQSWIMTGAILSLFLVFRQYDKSPMFSIEHKNHLEHFLKVWLQHIAFLVIDAPVLGILFQCIQVLIESRRDHLAFVCLDILTKQILKHDGLPSLPMRCKFEFVILRAECLRHKGDALGLIALLEGILMSPSEDIMNVKESNFIFVLKNLLLGYIMIRHYKSSSDLYSHRHAMIHRRAEESVKPVRVQSHDDLLARGT